jgi:Arc/MetJ-type ribon-helix-helix transcriptional regulator
MSIVTVRVDERTKKKMSELRHVNWSSVLREAIEKKLEQEGDRDLAKALLANDKLRRKAPPGWDSIKVIRYWREHRYGRSSNRR